MIIGFSTLGISDFVYDIKTGFASVKGFRQEHSVSWKWYLWVLYPVLLIFLIMCIVNALARPPHPLVPFRYVPDLLNTTEYSNYTIDQYPCNSTVQTIGQMIQHVVDTPGVQTVLLSQLS